MFYPIEDTGTKEAAALAMPRRKPVAAALVEALPSMASEAELSSDGSDPFAPRSWTAPAPVPQAVLVAAPLVVAPVDLTQPGPPELPFRYVGNLVDGAEQVVYVARGDQAYVLHAGDAVDGTYKVLGITPAQIEFEHIPTGVKQALAFPVREP
jgi:hypothetical protein